MPLDLRIGLALFSVILTLASCSASAASSTDMPGASAPFFLADVGGPYSGEAGQEITLDGSASRDAKSIESYVWDFGDGKTGNGQIVTHTYIQAGFYNATLTITGFDGEKNTDRTGVYVRNVEFSMEVIVYPAKTKYEYGDRITSVDVIVRRINNGTGVEKAIVSGTMIGKENIDLKFKEKGGGRYRADLLYPILKGEDSFVEYTVKAQDSFGNAASRQGKLLVSSGDSDFAVVIEEPKGNVFDYGQMVRFKVRLINVAGNILENDSVTLYEGWSGKNYSFTKKEDAFYYTYEVPKDAEKEIAFLVNGKAVMGGKQYGNAEILDFSISNKLNVAYITPALGEYAPNVSIIALNVTYPNGEQIRSDRLKAVINGEPAILNRNDQFFAANHTMRSGEKMLDVKVEDGMGNSGESTLQLIPENARAQIDSVALAIILALAVVLVLCAALALRYSYTKKHKEDLKKEYEELKQQREALKKLMKTIMHEYYTRKITSDDAKKRMLDYEKELLIEREKMRSVLHKLGIKMETEGKEEVIEWIVEKLEEGEDPELLKEGLADTGIDPRIVDDIKKNLV